MLSNMRLAAPEVDSALVELLSRWALRGRHASPEPKVCGRIRVLLGAPVFSCKFFSSNVSAALLLLCQASKIKSTG